MTGQPYDEDDAEFDAFLQGKGPLAQGLAELPQREPSAALDAAILAHVTTDLARGAAVAAGQAANDDAGPHDFQPYRWRERWRMPLALAAGVTAISIALPMWQDEVAQQQQAANAPLQEMHIPAVPPAAPEPVATVDAAAPAKAEAARRSAEAGQRGDSRDAAARQAAEREYAHAGLPAAQKRAQQSAPAMEAAPIQERLRDAIPAAAPAMPAPPAPAPAPVERPAPAAERAAAPVITAPVAMPAPVPAAPAPAPAPALPPVPFVQSPAPIVAPAPAFGRASAGGPASAPAAPKAAPSHHFVEDTDNQLLYTSAQVARIEQLLKEGKREEALAQWDRLRAAYPDYPLPDKLREALGR